MFKKLMIAGLLTIIVLAFPIRLQEVSPLLGAILKIAKGLLFITMIFFLMARERFLIKSIVLKSIPMNLYVKLLPVILLIAAYVIYFLSTSINNYQKPESLLLITLVGTLIAASAEEIIFRGYVLNLLKKNGYSLVKSLLLSSIFFSLVHIVNIFRHDDLWPLFNQIVFAFALGMLLGSIYALTQNLLLVCILHFLINIPTSIESIIDSPAVDNVLSNSTLLENLVSSFLFILLTAPVLILAAYYIKTINKRNGKPPADGRLSVAE